MCDHCIPWCWIPRQVHGGSRIWTLDTLPNTWLIKVIVLLFLKGRLLYDLIIYDVSLDPNGNQPAYLIEVDSEALSDFLKTLKMYKIRKKVWLSETHFIHQSSWISWGKAKAGKFMAQSKILWLQISWEHVLACFRWTLPMYQMSLPHGLFCPRHRLRGTVHWESPWTDQTTWWPQCPTPGWGSFQTGWFCLWSQWQVDHTI